MEQFTKKAASALKLAAKAARRRGHSSIGSEHLLLGLLEEGVGTAAQVLIGAGVEEEKLKSLIDQLIAPDGGVGLAILYLGNHVLHLGREGYPKELFPKEKRKQQFIWLALALALAVTGGMMIVAGTIQGLHF